VGSRVWREDKNTEFSRGNHLEDRQVHDEIDQRMELTLDCVVPWCLVY
jgi:hypothetical protein